MHFRMELLRLPFLLRSQVLPRFHAIQDLLLPIRRQITEPLQPLSQLLLLTFRQAAKLGIAIQKPLLLIRRQISALIEPLSRMMTLQWLPWLHSRRASGLALLGITRLVKGRRRTRDPLRLL